MVGRVPGQCGHQFLVFPYQGSEELPAFHLLRCYVLYAGSFDLWVVAEPSFEMDGGPADLASPGKQEGSIDSGHSARCDVAVHRGAIRELHLRILQCVFSLHLRPGPLGQVVVCVAKLGTWRPVGNSLCCSLYSPLVEHLASRHVANFG